MSNEQGEAEGSKPVNDKQKVTLSKSTLALLGATQEPPSPSKPPPEPESSEHPHWQWLLNNFLSLTGEDQSSDRTNTKFSRNRNNDIAEPLTEEQLDAPYVEEQRPERPFTMHSNGDYPESTSETPLISSNDNEQSEEEEQEQEQEPKHHISTVRRKFRNYVKAAAAANTANKAFANAKKHLQDTNTLSVISVGFPSPLTVPYFWAQKDWKGRRAPPVLLNAIKLGITDSERDSTYYNLQNVFRIELEYGDIKWVIKRTGFNFLELHLSLSRRPGLPELPKFPAGIVQWLKAKFWPGSGRHRVQRESAQERRRELEKYLLALLGTLSNHVCYDLYEFLELSAISITRDMGWKGKEGYLSNKVQRFHTPFCSLRNTGKRWAKEWVILRDSFIAFCRDIDSRAPTDVFLLDDTFKSEKYTKKGFVFQLHEHLRISNHARRIEIKGDSRTLNEFMDSIERIKLSSPWIKEHRHKSYAPIRESAKVKWYVDGKDYFHAVSEALMSAKTEIYIEDWWLSPELHLRRPPAENEEFRLDRLLKKKAEEGVLIYIVVYKEVSVALTLDSHHTKFYLQSLHPNIRVQRHPDHGPEGTMFWAHHEKMVVVDSRIAFIGGLDLCFGRYDTHTHQLADYHPSENYTIWRGQDYSNPRVKDFENVADFGKLLVDKKIVPRMPWHDVSVGMVGPPARDVARHFVQRWNFIKEEKGPSRETIPYLTPKGEYVSTRDESRFKGSCEVQILRSSADWSSGVEHENSIYRAYRHLILNAEHFIYIENQFFITATEKNQNSPVKNLIGEALVERIKKAHKEGQKFHVIVVMPLLPSFEADLNSKDAGTIRMVMHWQYVSICRGGHSILEKLREAGVDPEKYISFFALRSYDRINRSFTDTASSASVSSKQKGKQNEDLSSDSIRGSQDISIAFRAMDRSSTSLDSQQNPLQGEEDSFSDEHPKSFRHSDYQVDPVSPAGITEVDVKQNYVTEELYIHSKLLIVDDRYVICGSANLNDRSLLGNRDSEIAILIEDKQTIDTRMNGKQYKAGRFNYSLRSHIFKEHLGLIPPQDHHTITKSALPPINSEELYGHRKTFTITSIIGESSSTSTPKNPTPEDLKIMDPLSDDFYNYWLGTAKENTEIFRSVFRCVPDDNVVNWDNYKQFVPDSAKVPTGHVANTQASSEDIQQKLNRVRGHLVIFPLHFLEKEALLGSVITAAVTPAEIFT